MINENPENFRTLNLICMHQKCLASGFLDFLKRAPKCQFVWPPLENLIGGCQGKGFLTNMRIIKL